MYCTKFSAQFLDRQPTLCTGQTSNLKLDDGQFRYWLSRCSVKDGEPYNNKVSIEMLTDGNWVLVDEYQG
jgi:hypothetical protein